MKYFCVKGEGGEPVLQGEAEYGKAVIHINGGDVVTIDKMFGPLIYFPIRVTADNENCEWIIERLFGNDVGWREVARIPGQLDSDFRDDDRPDDTDGEPA